MNESSEISFASKNIEDLQVKHNIDVNPNTGSAVASVTLPVTQGRSGFGPNLALQYSSSSGNSTYGVGWSLSGLSAITIHTKKNLPRYDQKDSYAFNGAEELVRMHKEDGGAWVPQIDEKGDYWIYYYRRKTETDYTRFEKWINKRNRHIHWRTRSRDNVVSIYGLDARGTTRIADPENTDHVYSWLLESQYDRNGNAILYEYDSDGKEDLDVTPIFERHRVLYSSAFAQRYLKRIRYGNTKPLKANMAVPAGNKWLFQVVFDFGDHRDNPLPSHTSDQKWQIRQDPFSTHSRGFDVRTYRLCRRILMFHNFEEIDRRYPTLVGMFNLEHQEHPAGSVLKGITYTGLRKNPNTSQIQQRALPKLNFEYSSPSIGQSFKPIPERSKENVPYGFGDGR